MVGVLVMGRDIAAGKARIESQGHVVKSEITSTVFIWPWKPLKSSELYKA